MNKLLREAIGYTAASGCALIVDITLLWVLVHYGAFGTMTASTISFIVGGVVAYELSVRIAFQDHRLRDRRAELAAFLSLGLLGLAVNDAVIYAGVRYLNMQYLHAKALAVGFTFITNFLVRRQSLFVRRTAAS